MEQRIIAKLCPGQPIRRLNCNGDNVAVARVCDFLETQIRTMGNRNYPIIILLDREERAQSADEIAAEILDILQERGLQDQDVRVFVADRETEDWYLLDVDSIKRHYSLPDPVRPLQGKGGLSRLLKPAVDYHETSVGVDIFNIVSKKVIADQSPMFRKLMEAAVEMECLFAIDPDIFQ